MSSQAQKERDQGLSLLDIGPLSINVPVGNDKLLAVYGISAKGLFSIFQRFPQVGQWFKTGSKVDPQKLATEVPDALAAVIAAGCGAPNDEAAEAKAEMLPVEAQMDVIEAILKLTFSKGFGPFVQRIVALSKLAESQNFGRGQATKSPAVSSPASQPDTIPSSSGG